MIQPLAVATVVVQSSSTRQWLMAVMVVVAVVMSCEMCGLSHEALEL